MAPSTSDPTALQTPQPDLRVHVVGAGPVGLMLPALLQSIAGCSVRLYEKRRAYTRTRMVQLAPYLVADSVESYRTDAIDGDSVEAIFDPPELDQGLAFRQSIPPELNGLRGHAIECRVNAEDPARNYHPCPGHITAYHPPGGPGVRVDTHVYAGYTVPPYYDSLLAKVIVHGRDRAEALARMGQALESFILEGVPTTIPFLARLIRHPDFVAGRVDTKFLERETHLLQPEQ